MDDEVIMVLIAIVVTGIGCLIGIEITKDKQLTNLCLASGYAEQRRTSDDMYCIKRGVNGETIVTNVKDLK
jgi:hypothetical protein